MSYILITSEWNYEFKLDGTVDLREDLKENFATHKFEKMTYKFKYEPTVTIAGVREFCDQIPESVMDLLQCKDCGLCFMPWYSDGLVSCGEYLLSKIIK